MANPPSQASSSLTFPDTVSTESTREPGYFWPSICRTWLAARFAAKEALIKALGGHAVIRWHDMRIVQDVDGNPDFRLTGGMAEHIGLLGIDRVHLSMSHDAGIASAFVVLESDRSVG